jgi:hypothetical protein
VRLFWNVKTLALTGLLALTSLAGAEPPPVAGQRLYEAGERAFRKGEWERARRAFAEAYELDHKPELLYDLALATARLARADGKPDSLRAARDAYVRFLDEHPTGRLREQSERAVQVIEAELQIASTDVPRPPPGESTDTLAVPLEPALVQPPRSTPAPSSPAVAEPPTVGALPPASPTVAPPPATEPARPPTHIDLTRTPATASRPLERTPIYRRWWLWTTVAAAGVTVGVGLGVGLGVHRFSATLPDFGPGMSR